MAQGNAIFFATRMEWTTVNHYYYHVAGFDRFIFQPITLNSKKNDKDFVLKAYAVDISGNVIIDTPIILTATSSTFITADRRLDFGNIPFTRSKIDIFISDPDSKNFDKLFFNPKEYEDYIGYEVTPELIAPLTGTHPLTAITLNPSPPANAS